MRVSDSSSALASSPAFTVTVCAVDQFDAVKVSVLVLLSVVPEMDRSVPECPPMVTVTAPLGCAVSFTVYLTPVSSPSVTVREVGERTTFLISLSVTLTVTLSAAIPL